MDARKQKDARDGRMVPRRIIYLPLCFQPRYHLSASSATNSHVFVHFFSTVMSHIAPCLFYWHVVWPADSCTLSPPSRVVSLISVWCRGRASHHCLHPGLGCSACGSEDPGDDVNRGLEARLENPSERFLRPDGRRCTCSVLFFTVPFHDTLVGNELLDTTTTTIPSYFVRLSILVHSWSLNIRPTQKEKSSYFVQRPVRASKTRGDAISGLPINAHVRRTGQYYHKASIVMCD